MDLDQTDLRILAELQGNARISIAQLAERVALTSTPCARRIQRLEAAGFIRGYTAVLDQALVGLPVTAFVSVRLTHEGKHEVSAFESAIKSCPQVMECWAMSGRYDYLLRVVSSDLDDYNRFLRDRLLSLGCIDQLETDFALQRVLERATLPLEQLAQAAERQAGSGAP